MYLFIIKVTSRKYTSQNVLPFCLFVQTPRDFFFLPFEEILNFLEPTLLNNRYIYIYSGCIVSAKKNRSFLSAPSNVDQSLTLERHFFF